MLTLGWSPWDWDQSPLEEIGNSQKKELAQSSASQIVMIYGIPSWYMVYGYGYMGIPWYTEFIADFFGEKKLHYK